MEPPSSLSQLCPGRPLGWGRGGPAYLTAAGLPRGPRAASLVAAHNLLVWKHKVGVSKAGGNGIDPVWPDRWQKGMAPQGSWGWGQAPGLGSGGQPGEVPGDGGCDTHWWACTSRRAGWGCPHTQGHSWWREGGSSAALPCPHPGQIASPGPRWLSLTSHSGGLCSLGHMHHTWLDHPCPGSRCLRICGYQVAGQGAVRSQKGFLTKVHSSQV